METSKRVAEKKYGVAIKDVVSRRLFEEAKGEKIERAAKVAEVERFKGVGGVLGISLDDEHFTSQKVRAMIEWSVRQIGACRLLVGDSIHRHNIEYEGQLALEAAAIEAIRLGQKLREDLDKYVQEYNGAVTWLFCSTIQQFSEYNSYFTKLCAVYRNDASFALSLERMALKVAMRRHLRLGCEVDRDGRFKRAIELSTEYLLEEIAIFACLVCPLDQRLFLYPGSEIDTLVEILMGMHRGVPDELRERVSVYLRFT